ncbi:type II toxin-antitoxin system HicA family toxin [Candidatus Poriferisocius sp.]|uniref:type II toxin-antitoxin system HicA family toxin n=1 Tax=Candidatus Poriferisocius sp. TaxID=3101276 RepID=UPI003B518460
MRGADLQRALHRLGYRTTRQRGSHVRVTTNVNGEHHEVIPLHNSIKAGTLSSILKSVASHHEMNVQELLELLDLWPELLLENSRVEAKRVGGGCWGDE